MSSSSYDPHDVARASLQQLTELSRRANESGIPAPLIPPQQQPPPNSRLNSLPRLQTSPDMSRLGTSPTQQLMSPSQRGMSHGPPIPQSVQSPHDWSNHNGLQVLTVGHLLPRSAPDDIDVEEQVMPTAQHQNSAGPSSSGGGSGTSSNNRLRVRRKTYVPGWAVPPRVLLVEDDAVSRKLSSKFLQVLGVTADIAVDGDAAVKQMCLERYDLVLMVRD
jgi:osomolarity two-component system, response regulator SKN7